MNRLIVALISLTCASTALAQQSPLIFAAASLKNALDDIAGQWQRETGKKG